MQGPMGVLNTLTIPPGATDTQERLVIDGVRGAIFVYANGGPLGALVGSWASAAGTDPYGNSYPAGFQSTAGNSTIEGNNFILNSNGLFVYNQATSGPTTVNFYSGSGHWVAPAAVSSVSVQCWGPAGGGANGAELHQGSGGGGEYASDPNVAVTAGNSYNYTVGAGGAGGAQAATGNPGSAGSAASTFAGNSVTVTAHAGGGGTTSGGAGGSGSTNAIHFNGGNGTTIGSSGDGGAGGGSSAGTLSAGTNGHNNGGTNTGGAGGFAPAGGGDGGKGGNGGPSGATAGTTGALPGGGGGSGGFNTGISQGMAGGAGFGGQVSLTYTPAPSGLALVVSVCGIATTDPSLGVSCPIGVTVYNTTTQTVQANLGAANLSFIDTVNAVQAPGLIGLATVGVTNDSLQLNSPANAATDVQAFLALQKVPSGQAAIVMLANSALWIKTQVAGPAAPASGSILFVDTSGNLHILPNAANKVVLDNSNMTFLAGPALAAPSAGVMIGTDAGSLRMSYAPNTGTPMNFPGSSLATFPGNTIGNATLANLDSFTIPANDAEVGSSYEIEVDGNWTEATGTAVTFQFTGGFGSVSSGTSVGQIIGTTGFNAGGTGRFVGRVKATCVTTGATGTWRFHLLVTVTPNATPGNSVTISDATAGTPVAASTIVAQNLEIRFAWGSATGSPSLTSQTAWHKRIN